MPLSFLVCQLTSHCVRETGSLAAFVIAIVRARKIRNACGGLRCVLVLGPALR